MNRWCINTLITAELLIRNIADWIRENAEYTYVTVHNVMNAYILIHQRRMKKIHTR